MTSNPAGRLRRDRRPVPVAIVESAFRPERDGAGNLLRRTRGHPSLRLGCQRKLQREQCHAATDAADQHAFTRLQMGPRKNRPIRGQPGQRQRRRLGPGEMRGLGRQLRGRHGDFLRQRALARQPEDLKWRALRPLIAAPVETRVDDDLAPDERGIHAIAHRADGAGAVRTRDARPFQPGVLAVQDPYVAVVQRGGAQIYDHFAGRRFRIGDLGDGELLDRGKLDGAHG